MTQQEMLDVLMNLTTGANLTEEEESTLNFLIRNEDRETGLKLLSILAKVKKRAYLTSLSNMQYAKDLVDGYVEDMNEFLDELE